MQPLPQTDGPSSPKSRGIILPPPRALRITFPTRLGQTCTRVLQPRPPSDKNHRKTAPTPMCPSIHGRADNRSICWVELCFLRSVCLIKRFVCACFPNVKRSFKNVHATQMALPSRPAWGARSVPSRVGVRADGGVPTHTPAPTAALLWLAELGSLGGWNGTSGQLKQQTLLSVTEARLVPPAGCSRPPSRRLGVAGVPWLVDLVSVSRFPLWNRCHGR